MIFRRFRPYMLVLALMLLVTGCQQPRETLSPIPFTYLAAPASDHGTLIVFLPGNGDSVERFGNADILGIIESAGVRADYIAVDAHVGYYQEQNLVTRLKSDVIDPARSSGYENIWFIGNSLGGFGALYYMKFHPDDIRGAILLGPFLGFEEMLREIDAAGGVRRWTAGVTAPDDWEREFWKWVKDGVDSGSSSGRIYLGFGNRDRLIQGQRLLADVLPPEQVVEIRGGHDWDTWLRLLKHFMDDKRPVQQSAAP